MRLLEWTVALSLVLLSACQRQDRQALTLLIPEVDTGGFLLYTPPKLDMEDKGNSDVHAWSGTNWSSPKWDLVGFAYCDVVDPNVTPHEYVIDLWLAMRDIDDTEVKAFRRIGMKIVGVSPPKHSDGPILYDVQLGTDGEKLDRAGFLGRAKSLLNDKPLKYESNEDLGYWKVTETPQAL